MFSQKYIFLASRTLLRYGIPAFLIHRGSSSESLHAYRETRWKALNISERSLPKHVLDFSLYLNPQDESWMTTSLGITGVLNVPLTSLIMEKLSSGMTFVDVGSNIGYYTVLASRIVGKSGKVISFEPDNVSVSFLLRNLDLNSLHNIYIRTEAVTSYNGTAKFYYDNKGCIGSSLLPSPERKFSTVNSFMLDSLQITSTEITRIDAIKSHTGTDLAVLAGGLRLIEKYRPMLFILYQPLTWKDGLDIVGKLLKMGYCFYKIIRSPKLLRRVNANNMGSKPMYLYISQEG